MGIIKRCGLYVLLFGVSFIGLSGLLSDSVSAVSDYDDTFIFYNEPSDYRLYNGLVTPDEYFFEEPLWTEIKNARSATPETDAFADLLQLRFNNYNGDNINIYFQQVTSTSNQMTIDIYNLENEFIFNTDNGVRRVWTEDVSTRQRITLQYSPWQGKEININSNGVITSNGNHSIYSNNPTDCTNCFEYYYMNLNVVYPQGYEGPLLDGQSPGFDEQSSWTPDIKLLQGTDWLVELSDYNFFTFDKVAFTCGEHDLAPIINWEVWDITDDPNRVLIDTLIYGAPALVKYQAPKIQEDKIYEIVAYYSDCEGYTFTDAETRQFTVKKDGNLKSTDLAAVCITEEFPYINIPNCLGDINDMFVTLTFRTPEADEVSGGGWTNLVNGCRQLQVIDDWIMKPDIVVCPQMPEQVRSIITPMVTFALALGVITFVANRQGIRGLG